MILHGKLFAESPLYRGNARKTLFTRDGDGKQRLVSLAGEISGTAEALMDAFIGRSRSGKNTGLVNRLWMRLFDAPMPDRLITRVECRLEETSYPKDHFFDLRMGIKLDEDRWAAEANANYKMETLYRNSVFDFSMHIDETLLHQREHAACLHYLLQELQAGRFWFGAGKSKGLGRCRLEADIPFSLPEKTPKVNRKANHLTLSFSFNATNPVLVGWNWGKVEPDQPAFAAIEGRLIIEALRDIPEPVRRRLEMGMAGPILNPEDCKQKLAQYLPRAIATWLIERSSSLQEVEVWLLPATAVARLGAGKYPVPKKMLGRIQPLVDKPFPSREAAESAFNETMGKEARKYRRILERLEQRTQSSQEFDAGAWDEVAQALGLDATQAGNPAAHIEDEAALTRILARLCQPVLPRFHQQLDQQLRLLQSDVWVDEELAGREEHIRIKTMLQEGEIDERQWKDPALVPEGIRNATWEEFLRAHDRVQYRHMVHPKNLQKSIANDRNYVAFLRAYRDRIRQEMIQPHHIDFRAGGSSGREVARKYGKPYDTVFMRMLSWSPSAREQGLWEVYVPGSTVKGAFRKRASQILQTIRGASSETTRLLHRLFGTMGQRGLVFFSDAYLADPRAPEQTWCSMDGVRMDPKTGRPLESAKADYLFAYGEDLVFRLSLDLQDIREEDVEALSLLAHLVRDFQRGDIPLGGEKTSGFGWVKARMDALDWMATAPSALEEKLFGAQEPVRDGMWRRIRLEGEAAASWMPAASLAQAQQAPSQDPPRAARGFISHRAFGGYCGTLSVEAEVLTPLSVRESGEPSYRAVLQEEPVNGWDFFSMSPPEAASRGDGRVYALPSKSLKGMVRHIYSIAGDARKPSPDIGRLNPADSLFGFVGTGPNQALAGRVSFGFGTFREPQLAWFKAPYPYGEWQYRDGRWQSLPGSKAAVLSIAETWRVFPHAPLAPCVVSSDDFQPDVVQASYFRALLPGTRGGFSVRFWNLEKEELERLIWCLSLEEDLAHKMGQCRYLGFGSLRLRIRDESFLIEWNARYGGASESTWRRPVAPEQWRNPDVIAHHAELKKALNAERL